MSTATSLPIVLLLVAKMSFAMVPGGLAAGHAYASGNAVATQMASTIEVDVDPGVTSYFWAQQFWLNTTVDHGGYFGIQGNGATDGQGAVGKMLIFSIWNATGAEPDPGAIAQPFGGEGIGFSIHRTYAWHTGVAYTFTLAKDGTTGWRVSVHASTGEDIGMGRIDISEDTTLQTGFANFTEYYADLSSCAALPFARVTFSNLTYGSVLVPFNDTAPYGTCISHATATLPATYRNMHEVNAPDTIFRDGFE